MKKIKDVINYLEEKYCKDEEDIKPEVNGKEIINEEPPEDEEACKESLAGEIDNDDNREARFTIEQEEEEKTTEETPSGNEAGGETVDTAVNVGDVPADTSQDLGGDVGGDFSGTDMGTEDTGAFGTEEEKNIAQTYSEVGRAYELKKINSRLSSLDLFLSTTLDPKLTKLKELVSKAIDMFNTVISNFDIYKDKIDEIIVDYYKFLTRTYTFLTDYYKKENKEDK